MTQNEIRDRLLELARVRLKARFGAFEQFRFTLDGLPAGAAILTRAALMPAPWTVGLSLGLDEAARQIDAHLLRLIDEWAQQEAPARQIPALEGVQPLPAEPQAEVPEQLAETAQQRRARRYQMCIDAGMALPDNDYASLPRGIGEIAKREGIKRQSFAEDVKAHIRHLNAS